MTDPAVVIRKVTQEAFDAQLAGGRRVAPGIWIDRGGYVHWSVPELLQLAGLDDTVENREAVTTLIYGLLRESGVTIVRQDPVTS